jgi:hypothetical protein
MIMNVEIVKNNVRIKREVFIQQNNQDGFVTSARETYFFPKKVKKFSIFLWAELDAMKMEKIFRIKIKQNVLKKISVLVWYAIILFKIKVYFGVPNVKKKSVLTVYLDKWEYKVKVLKVVNSIKILMKTIVPKIIINTVMKQILLKIYLII